ncbi:hypothetical protein [Ekhidna sp.]|uniref:hypothetical protein n=1 Tax=Ekhidna sp. TaxID=2608089 RepID=UPI0032ECD4F6
MANKQFLKLLKISILFLPSLISAQNWEKINEFNIKNAPTSYAADIQGNFYLGFADGSLAKYNSRGILQENYSLSNVSAISLIDVQNNLKPFLFYFDNQQITVLDRFSSVPKNYDISDLGVQFGMMACPSPDGDFWMVENNPQRLKKINPLRKAIVLEVQISIGDSIKKIQAYQNLLFIADEMGIHFFDQFGGFLRSHLIQGLLNFQVRDGILFVYTNEELREYSLSKSEVLNSVKLPELKPDAILKLKDNSLFIRNKKLTFYQLNEN